MALSRGSSPARSVLRSPAVVPPLLVDGQTLRKANAPQHAKDEVAAILKGLKLDRNFFFSRVRPADEALALAEQTAANHAAAPRHSRKGSAADAMQRHSRRADFDIYANEALMPVLAQALDSLCRQLERMKLEGDNLDPKVKERFNPLTWIAQQLLRSHPKCARTPRRQALYKSFSDWSDQERGRREMLRHKETVEGVFNGFCLRGGVQVSTIPTVLEAIDGSLRLEGKLKDNVELSLAMGLVGHDMVFGRRGRSGSAEVKDGFNRSISAVSVDCTQSVNKDRFFKGEKWTFEKFWQVFSKAIMTHDLVPYSAIANGIELKKQEAKARAELEEARRLDEQRREAAEEEERKAVEEYTKLLEQLQASPEIRNILDAGKILTGDDMRPTDPGFEHEVPPQGIHCWLLHTLLTLLGFKDLPELEDTDDTTDEIEGWWTVELAQAWMLVQELEGSELVDGVVEKECLSKVLVEPDKFAAYKRRVEDEIERRASGDNEEELARRRASRMSFMASEVKPSMNMLSVELGATIARLNWLHQLFTGFLQPEDPNAPAVICRYPDDPASISKATMRKLVEEVKPGITEAEFEAKFQRIDSDGSGTVEFDEFARWVAMGEVHITAETSRKMTFEELAELYDITETQVQYFHQCFEDQLPEGQSCNYPDEPALLPKKEMKSLLQIMGIKMSDKEFNSNFDLADQDNMKALAFDQFLEVIDIDSLPEELKKGAAE